MWAFNRGVAALALRAMPTKPPEREKRLVAAIDDARQSHLDRAAISQQRAALIASLWPEPTRQCIAPAVFAQFAAPAVFGLIFRFGAPQKVDARALQTRLNAAFGAAKAPLAAETAKAA